MKRIPIGLRYMAASAFFFSIMAALVKLAGRGLPTMEVVLARSLVGLVLSAATILARGGSVWGGERRILALRGILGFIALTCFYWAVIHLPLAEATVIQYTNPLFAALLAVPVLGERLRSTELTLVLLGLIGVGVVAWPPGGGAVGAVSLEPFGVAVALAGALFSGAAYVTVRRLRAEDPLVIVFYFALISTVATLPAVIPVLELPTPTEWLVLLGVGVATHAGQVCLTTGLRTERAGLATAVGYLQIVFAALWGVLFFYEVPGPWSAVGAFLIVVSTLLLARGATRDRPPAPPGPPAAV